LTTKSIGSGYRLKGAGADLCDVLIIGVDPDVGVRGWNSGSTINSALLMMMLCQRELMKAWDEGADLHRRGEAA